MPKNPHDLADAGSARRLGRVGRFMAAGGVLTVAATYVAAATVLDPVEPTTIFSVRAVVVLLAGAVTLAGLGCIAAARVAARGVGQGTAVASVALAAALGFALLGMLGGLAPTSGEASPTAPVAGTYELPCGASAITGTPAKTITGPSALDAVETVRASGVLGTVQFAEVGLPDSSDVTLVAQDPTTGTDVAAVTITQGPDGPWTVRGYQVCPR